MSRHPGRGWALAFLVGGVLLVGNATFAQPALPRAGATLASLTALDLLMPEVVGAGSSISAVTASMVVDAPLQGLIDDLLNHSPAFRRQWRRLERFPRLSVRIELVHASHVGGDAHAATRISASQPTAAYGRAPRRCRPTAHS